MKKKNLVKFKNWIIPPHFVVLPQAKACGNKQETCYCWNSYLLWGKRKINQCLLLPRFLWGLEEMSQEHAGILGQHHLHWIHGHLHGKPTQPLRPGQRKDPSPAQRRCVQERCSWWFTLGIQGTTEKQKSKQWNCWYMTGSSSKQEK